MTAFDDHVHWFEVDRLLTAVWLHTSESVPWIARATDEFLQGMGRAFGIPRWNFPEGTEWSGGTADLERLVESQVARDRDDNPRPKAGYNLGFLSPGDPVGAEVTIFAGDIGVGSRIPLHKALVRPRPLRSAALTSEMVDAMCEAAIRAWQPARVEFSSSTVRELNNPQNNWWINPAWRLWLSDEVATIDHVTDGVTATRMHGGTMLSVPDELTAEQVVETMGPTLRANELTDIPHETAR